MKAVRLLEYGGQLVFRRSTEAGNRSEYRGQSCGVYAFHDVAQAWKDIA
jgi:hypothetical protein